MNRLSPMTSRLVALSILAIAIMFPVFYLFIPLVGYYGDLGMELESLKRNKLRFEHLIANEAEINQNLERVKTLEEEGNLFLKGNKEPIASANLREFVNEAVRRSGGQLVSSQEYDAAPMSSVTPIGLRLQVSGEIYDLVNLLYEVENARPLIFIDNLTVTSNAAPQRTARTARRLQKRTPVVRHSLNVRLDIVGYMPGKSQ